MIRHFSWKEFDKSVEYIANKSKFWGLSGIYGIPRGGLCLATALSHKLNLKIIEKPIKNSLIVDDIYDTGLTLGNYKNIEGAYFFVLFSKKKPTWWHTVNISSNDEWIVFPWEDPKNSFSDKKDYKKRRSLN